MVDETPRIKKHFWTPYRWTRIKDDADFLSEEEATQWAERLRRICDNSDVGLLYISSPKVRPNPWAVIMKEGEA